MKTHCSNCDNETNHNVRGEFKPKDVYTTSKGTNEQNEYYIIQCKGCDHVGFLNIKFMYKTGEEQGKGVDYQYPENELFYFLSEDDIDELEEPICSLYDELKSILMKFNYIAAGALFRMILEAVCDDQKKKGLVEDKKTIRLKNNGLISGNDYQVLQRVQELGNISIHQARALTDDEIDATLEAINHLLRIVFIVSKRTDELKNRKKEK